MKIEYSQIFVLVLTLAVAGCASIKETSKVVWGSSTKALEEARVSAAKKAFTCKYNECFDAVLEYSGTEKAVEPSAASTTSPAAGLEKPVSQTDVEYSTNPGLNSTPTVVAKKKIFSVFIKDRKQGHIVLMGVPGAVDTTEVGVFFTPKGDEGTLIEISSLSTSAKVKVADMVFEELGKTFEEIKN